jgi:hypothetical protein
VDFNLAFSSSGADQAIPVEIAILAFSFCNSSPPSIFLFLLLIQ